MNEAMLELFSKPDMGAKNIIYRGRFRKGNKKTSGKRAPEVTMVGYDMDTPLGIDNSGNLWLMQ